MYFPVNWYTEPWNWHAMFSIDWGYTGSLVVRTLRGKCTSCMHFGQEGMRLVREGVWYVVIPCSVDSCPPVPRDKKVQPALPSPLSLFSYILDLSVAYRASWSWGGGSSLTCQTFHSGYQKWGGGGHEGVALSVRPSATGMLQHYHQNIVTSWRALRARHVFFIKSCVHYAGSQCSLV